MGKMGENGDSALFLEEKIGRCPHFPPGAVPIFPHFPGRCPHFPASSSGGGLYEGEKYGMS